jgi:hypothetical protein
MRVEVGTPGIPATYNRSAVVSPAPRRRFDRFELGVLIAFAAVSLWVLGLDLWQVAAHGRVWTGTDGVYIVDQMQYLSWIRSASHHLLASNMFVLRSTPADYFQPAVVISGGLSALGIAPWVSLLLWKPVAVFALFFAVREYAYRSVAGLWSRRLVILLSLFFGCFTIVYGSFGVLGDLFPGFLSWGYTFGLLSLALMVGALLSYDRARREGRVSWMPGLLGALASLLHPWHGELTIAVVLGAELMLWWGRRPTRRDLRLPALTAVVAGLPLIYYSALGKLDLSWKLAREASKHAFSFWTILIAVLPLLLPALLAYRGRSKDFIQASARFWPIASFGVFIVSASGVSATPLHAFQGITIPLSVLAVQGVQRVGWRRLPYVRWVTAAVVVLLTVPTTYYELDNARKLAAPTRGNANFIQRDERDALDYLADSHTPGGVLTGGYLGSTVPERTGRQTLLGDCLWSEPHCSGRAAAAAALFGGKLSGTQAQRFVRRSGARFVLADCYSTANLDRLLRPLVVSVNRFGCARVFELVAPSAPKGPLAQSRRHASVRATGRK